MNKLIRMWVAIAASVACFAQTAVVHASEPANPAPKGNFGDWANGTDYPEAALIAEMEGVTRFTLDVDPHGKATACTITDSSGSEVLDARTCELLLARADFEPAKNGEGRPVVGTWSNAVQWEIPELDLGELGEPFMSYIVERDGSVSDCNSISGRKREPAPCPADAEIITNMDADGNPTRAFVTLYLTSESLTSVVIDQLPD